MTSELRVDRIIPVDGIPPSGGGGIIQVVSTYDTDHIRATTSSTYVDVMEATITPKKSTSKILVLVSLSVSKDNDHAFLGRVLRNDSVIAGGDTAATNSTDQSNWEDGIWFAIRSFTYSPNTYSHHYLDSPSSTSALTYKVQGKTSDSGAGHEFAINVAHTEANNVYGSPTFSNITLMEISA